MSINVQQKDTSFAIDQKALRIIVIQDVLRKHTHGRDVLLRKKTQFKHIKLNEPGLRTCRPSL